MDGRINFIGGLFDLKLKVLVPFLRVKSCQRATSPPRPFFPNASDQNFGIVILFDIV